MPNINNEHYDLILVMGYFRSALSFLSIVKHLKSKRIGLITSSSVEVKNKKVDKYTEKFITLLKENGAKICLKDQKYSTDLIVVQQHVYDDDFIKIISKNITYKKAIALIGYRLGYGGNDLFLKYFDISICAINDKNLFKLFVDFRKCKNLYNKYEIREVGIPFLDYPPFETPYLDWLIASPTTFSFDNEKDKHKYLKNIIILLGQIDNSKTIAYKPHNGNQRDYFKKYNNIANLIPFPCLSAKLIELFISYSHKLVKKHFSFILTALLNKIILKRAVNLSKLSDKHYLPIEAFIPNLREGIIGGNSNTIWATRFYKKKYLNCIEPKKFQSKEIYKKKNITLLTNLSYFGVPFCQNDINYKIDQDFKDYQKLSFNIVDLINENFDKNK